MSTSPLSLKQKKGIRINWQALVADLKAAGIRATIDVHFTASNVVAKLNARGHVWDRTDRTEARSFAAMANLIKDIKDEYGFSNHA